MRATKHGTRCLHTFKHAAEAMRPEGWSLHKACCCVTYNLQTPGCRLSRSTASAWGGNSSFL